jgi:predicted phage terminase large subunit-like protein
MSGCAIDSSRGDDKPRFVPASFTDNPYLDQEAYSKSLDQLDPVTRAQLKHADWKVRPEGNLFRREWFTGKIIDALPGDIVRRVRYWDLAATEVSKNNTDPDFTACVEMGQTSCGEFIVMDAQEARETPANVENLVQVTADADGVDVEVYIEQEPGASGKTVIDHYRRRVLPGHAVYGVPSSGDKITRAKPFSAACQNGLVMLLRGSWIGRWLDRLCSFGTAGAHDDTVDASSGAHRALTRMGDPMQAQDWSELVGYDETDPGAAQEGRMGMAKFMRGEE